jgi:hypothetical protein
MGRGKIQWGAFASRRGYQLPVESESLVAQKLLSPAKASNSHWRKRR